MRVTEGINPLLRPRFLLVAPRAAERRVKATGGQSIQQRLGLQQTAALLRTQRKRVRALQQRFAVLLNDQFRADFLRVRVAKLDHLREFVAGIDVQQWEGYLARI